MRLIVNKQMQRVDCYKDGRRHNGYSFSCFENVDSVAGLYLELPTIKKLVDARDWYEKMKKRMSWKTI